MKFSKQVIFAAVISTLPSIGKAQVSGSWLGGLGGTWTDGSNWTSAPSFPDGGGVATFGVNDLRTSTVTLNSRVTVSSLYFGASRYFFDGTGTILLVGPAEIYAEETGDSAGHFIDAVAGSNGLVKNGPGAVRVRGNFTGEALINDGVFAYSGGGSLQSIRLNGGTLQPIATIDSAVTISPTGGTIVAGTSTSALAQPLHGTGTLSLEGVNPIAFQAASDFSGPIRSNGSTITLNGTLANVPTISMVGAGLTITSRTATNNQIGDNTDLRLQSSRLRYTHFVGGADSETAGNITLVSGLNNIYLDSTTFSVSQLVRENRATMHFQTPLAAAGSMLITGQRPALSGVGTTGSSSMGILPWAMYYNGDPLTVDTSGYLRPLATGESLSSLPNDASTSNVILANGGVASAPSTINSLSLKSGSISGSSAITVTSGALYVGNGTQTAATYTVNAPIDFGSAEGIIHVPEGFGEQAVLSGPISGSNGLTIAGATELGGISNYSGPTTVDGSLTIRKNVSPGIAGPLGIDSSPVSLNARLILAPDNSSMEFGRKLAVTGDGKAWLFGANSDGLASKDITLSNDIQLDSSLFITANDKVTINLTGTLSGTGGIYVSHLGSVFGPNDFAVIISGNNTYSGITRLERDFPTKIRVGVGSDTAFGSGTLYITSEIFAVGAARTIANPTNLSNSTFSGSLPITLTGPMNLGGLVLRTVVNSATTTFAGTVSNGSLTRTGSGFLAMKNIRLTGLTLMQGITSVVPNATVTATSKLQSLAITNGAVFDLTNNDLILDYEDASPIETIRGMLLDGRLTTSTADSAHALGYAEAAALGATSFNAEHIDTSTLLIKYTYAGDSNLDGKVDIRDLYNLASHYNTSGDVWTSGDFNYDGNTNVKDLTLLATNWQAGAGAPLGSSLLAALTNVGLPINLEIPEPCMMGIFAAAGFLTLRRRGTNPSPRRR